MSKNKIVIRRVMLTILSVLMIGFIFFNSALDADLSSDHSGGVREFINSVLSSLHTNIVLSEHFVRKCAHFAEYFVLGTLLFYTVYSYVLKLSKRIYIAPLSGLLVACIDESIQLFSEGRSAQISDVMLDFFGVCLAVILFYIITDLYIKGNPKVREY